MKKRIISATLAGILSVSSMFVVYADVDINNSQEEITVQESDENTELDIEDEAVTDEPEFHDESAESTVEIEDEIVQSDNPAPSEPVILKNHQVAAVGESSDTETDLVTLLITEYEKTMLNEAFYLNLEKKDGVSLSYSSSNEGVVRVEENGLVVICGSGEAIVTISAAYEEQTQSAEAHIIVSKVNQSISMSTATITKKYGSAKFQIKANAKTPVTFQSSDANVLTVDDKGYVTIVAKNSTKSAYVIVTAPVSDIYNAAPQKKVLIKWTKADQKIAVSKTTFELGNKNKSLGATAKTGMTFKSNNTSVATVNSKGQITTKKVGTAKITITAKSSNRYNSVKKTVTIKVTKKSQTITAANKTYTMGSKNKSLGAKAKTTLSYKSSNSSVVSVTSKGKITAKKAGTAKITITAKGTKTYKSAKKVITITVKPKATTISAISSPSEKKMSVTVKKGSSVSGYQIRYATSSSMSGAKTFTMTGTKKTLTISEVENKSIKYYVQVRTYKTVSGKKYYSNWSTAKGVTVKGHSHSWKEIYQTISHEEIGHYETRVIEEAWDEPVKEWRTICNGCGGDLTDYDASTRTLHLVDCYPGSYSVKYIQVDTIHHPAQTEEIWIVDVVAWEEKILIGHECTGCGTTK